MDHTEYTPEELKAVREEFAKGSTDQQFTNFMRECRVRKLIPGRHIYFQLRKVKLWDADTRATIWENRAIHQTSIDAFRLIAQRSGEYRGQDSPKYIYLDEKGDPTVTSVIPLSKQPYAVRVSIYREHFEVPMTATARWDACAVYFKRQGSDAQELNEMWKRRGPEQLAKCAEAMALRQAFPEELGGLWFGDDDPDDTQDAPEELPARQVSKVPAPAPVRVPDVNQTPATGTNEPRPNESRSSIARTATDGVLAPKVDKAALDKDARKPYIARIKVYSREILPALGIDKAADALMNFIAGYTGKEDVLQLTQPEYEDVLKTLDDAHSKGELKNLLVLQEAV